MSSRCYSSYGLLVKHSRSVGLPFHRKITSYSCRLGSYRSSGSTGTRNWVTPGMIALGSIPFITLGLGIWQIKRLKWKLELIDELSEILASEPLKLPSRINVDALSDFEFRKVFVEGIWDHNHSVLIGPKVYEGIHGYHLITPLIRPAGASTIIVNRGFISKSHVHSKYLPKSEQLPGETAAIGLLRRPPRKYWSTPQNRPEEGKWHWMDIDAIAGYLAPKSAPESNMIQPVLVEEIFDGDSGETKARLAQGIPIGRPPSVELRNTHATYAFIWFSLSFITGAMFVAAALGQRRRGSYRMPSR